MSDSNSYLVNLYGGASTAGSAGSQLLNTLYGGATNAAPALAAVAPAVALRTAEKAETTDIVTTQADPQAGAVLNAFDKAVTGATDARTLLQNPAVLNVLLTANGLGDQVGNTALADKVLLSNPKDPASAANQVSDARWKAVAKAYNFYANGVETIKQPAVLAAIATNYTNADILPTAQDQATLKTFDATVKAATDIKRLLRDPTVLKVLLTANGLADQVGNSALAENVLLSNLKDPKSAASLATDPRWKTLAQAYDFYTNGLKAIQAPGALARTTGKFIQANVVVTAKDPQVQATLNAFDKAVKGASDVKHLLADPAVLKVLLTANGLGDQVGNNAVANKVLLSNLSDPKSLANQIGDTRWKTLAQTYDFASNGLKAIQAPTVLAAVATGYATIVWDRKQDQTTPGIAAALNFVQNAKLYKSAVDILGNLSIRNVVTTALGIPSDIAYQSLEAQQQAISSRLDVKKLQDPKFVESFAERYLLQVGSNASASASSSAPSNITTLAASLSSASA